MDNLAFTPDWNKLSEKQKIEIHTADRFLSFYNKQFGTSYKITAIGDAPDITCQWEDKGLSLFLEITLTEDLKDDIASALGRKNTRSLEKVSKRKGYSIECPVKGIIKKILEKISMRYGNDVALVVRHVSGVDWDFDLESDKIREEIRCALSPFDKGIWILVDKGLIQIC